MGRYPRDGPAAEAIGLDSIWVGDHLLYRYLDDAGHETEPPRGPWEAWTTLAAVAAVTERVELGPLVAATSFHNPAMLAKKAATLDEISGGRLILGLGAGWNEAEYTAYGYPFDHRVSRFEEAFTIIRSLLHDGHADLPGTYYTVTDAELVPRGPRPEGPPLMVGSIGERMLSITLPHVQYWNAWFTWFGNSPEGYSPDARARGRGVPQGGPRSGDPRADGRALRRDARRAGRTPGQPRPTQGGGDSR